MGRRKRLCITTDDNEQQTNFPNDQSSKQANFEDQSTFSQTSPNDQSSEISANEHSSEQGAPKKVRGYTRKSETWNMSSSQKIVVTFNRFEKPVSDEGNELGQYIGTLVRMADNVGIDYYDWRKFPEQKKEDMYTLVKFVIYLAETSKIKDWIIYSMGKKWRTWKGSLKARAYDSSLTIDQIVAQQTEKDNRVNPTQFKELVKSWFNPKYQSMCTVRRESRLKIEDPHVSGTKSFARLAEEEVVKNHGVYPSRGQIYVKSHTRKNGNIVNDKAAKVVASLQAIASDSTSTEGSTFDFSNDDYSKVKGPEKRGYI